jgi:predicted AlkP superfamily pyrophosphatase or phosphodiesterase
VGQLRREGELLNQGQRFLATAAAAVVIALQGVTAVPQGAAPGALPAAKRPRLVLFVSVDQMWPEYLDRFAPFYTSGLKRLREEGAFFTNAYYRHSNSETGPGHAVLLSGRHARDNGIVANDWYDRLAGGFVNVVDDPARRPLPGPGRAASPQHLMGFTIGDLLKQASPDSRVVGVAGKDRSAVLMAGHAADAAYWYEVSVGGFASSTYYMPALPPWLVAWNRAGHVNALAGRAWTRLLPDEAAYLKHAGPDDVKGEWDNVDTTFPHRIRGTPPSREFYDDVRRTPFADELVLDVALGALEAHDLGRDDATDLLAVGFSATDSIGHTYGPDSQEIMDQLIRLDRTLGRLIEAAEARAGKDGLLIGLSADHSSLPLVELLKAKGIDARRASPDVIKDAVTKALAARFPGAGDLVLAFDMPHVYLNLDRIAQQRLQRSDVEAVVEQALRSTGLVDRVYTAARLLGDPPAGDPDFVLFRNSFFESRSPHVIARLKPYVYLDSRPGGTGHGTVHDYDRHVPVVFAGAGIAKGRYEAACGPEDIAPTLAVLLGLPYRVEPGQRVLTEAVPAAVARGDR